MYGLMTVLLDEAEEVAFWHNAHALAQNRVGLVAAKLLGLLLCRLYAKLLVRSLQLKARLYLLDEGAIDFSIAISGKCGNDFHTTKKATPEGVALV